MAPRIRKVDVMSDLLEEARRALELGDDVSAALIVRKALINASGSKMNPVVAMGRPPLRSRKRP